MYIVKQGVQALRMGKLRTKAMKTKALVAQLVELRTEKVVPNIAISNVHALIAGPFPVSYSFGHPLLVNGSDSGNRKFR